MILAVVLLISIGLPALLINTAYYASIGGLAKYYKTIAITLDQVGGALIYGTEDWTVSAYTHLMSRYEGHLEAKIFEWVVDVLALLFEKEHCKMTYERERLELRKDRGEK